MFENLMSIVNIDGLIAATVIAAIGKSFVDFIKTPIEKHTGYNMWYASYVALVFGLVLTIVGGINMLCGEYFSGPVGVILTGLYAGGVSVGINEVLKKIKGEQVIEPNNEE